MAKQIGRNTTIFIGHEETRGILGTPEYAVPVRSIDIDDAPEYLDNDSGYGNIAEFNDSDFNRAQGSGGYDGKVFDNVIGAELRATFGQAPTTSVVAGETGVYKHEFGLANNNAHNSLSIFLNEQTPSSYELAMVDTFTLTAALDDYLARAITFGSRPSKAWTPGAPPAYTRGNEFLARDLSLKMADNLAGLSSGETQKVTSFSLEISKNLDVQYVFGVSEPDDIQNQQFNASGSFEYRKDNETIRNMVMGNIKKAIRFSAVSGATIGTSSHPTLEFDIPYAAFKEDSKSRDNNAIETRTANFQANYSLEDAAILIGRVINTVDEY